MGSRFLVFVAMTLFTLMPELSAQQANYEESKVPKYELPNLLTFANGDPLKGPEDWPKRRREILALFEQHVYGTMPDGDFSVKTRTVTKPFEIANAPGTAYQIELDFQNNSFKNPVRVLLCLPDSKKPVPVFVAYNFQGNHTVIADPGVVRGKILDRNTNQLVRADEKTRGAMTRRWDVKHILENGMGLATLHYDDVDPDFDDGFKNGVHSLYPKLQNREDNWTSIGAWAWGLSRVVDALEHDNRIDTRALIVMGHSRLGKTALWAGATDERFAAVISNNSGCGGAALARRKFGETVARINTVFPHWFCKKHKLYGNNETAMPVDQHMLIALMAPRPVYIASAVEDRWADPKGEFLAAVHSQPAYSLLGLDGGLPDVLPELDTPVGNILRYHIRSGKHDVTSFDWVQFVKFAKSLRQE